MAFDFGSYLKPIGGIVSSLAPVAGTVLGGLFGGPSGAMTGGGIGSALGNVVGGLMGRGDNQAAQVPQAPQAPVGNFPGMSQQNPMQSFSQLGQSALGAMVPPQYQGMSFGQMGNQLMGRGSQAINQFLGPQAQQAGLGESLMSGLGGAGSSIGNYLQGRFGQNSPFQMPSMDQFSQMSPQSFGQGLAGMGQQYLGNRFPGMASMMGGNQMAAGRPATSFQEQIRQRGALPPSMGMGYGMGSAPAAPSAPGMGMGSIPSAPPMESPYSYYKRGGLVKAPHLSLRDIAEMKRYRRAS